LSALLLALKEERHFALQWPVALEMSWNSGTPLLSLSQSGKQTLRGPETGFGVLSGFGDAFLPIATSVAEQTVVYRMTGLP
jgi:hypothetical protein